jgi:hypothetical protein
MSSASEITLLYVVKLVRLLLLLLIFGAGTSDVLADYQRLVITPRELPIIVSSRPVEVESYCLDHDLDPPNLGAIDLQRIRQRTGDSLSDQLAGPVPYPAVITPDVECVYVGRNSKPITVAEAIKKFGLIIEGISRISNDSYSESFRLRFRSRVPLRIDLKNQPLAFSHTEGTLDEPNVIDADLYEFLKGIKLSASRLVQVEIWDRNSLLELLRTADYWDGPKDYVTTKRFHKAEQQAREDLKVPNDRSLAEVLERVSLSKHEPHREQLLKENKARVRIHNLNLPDIQLARSSALSPSEYLRNPKNSPTLVNYEKAGSEEIFVHLNSLSEGSSSPDDILTVTVSKDGREVDNYGIEEFQLKEIDEARRALLDQRGSFAIYARRSSREGSIRLSIGNRSLSLTKQEFADLQQGNAPESLKRIMESFDRIEGKKSQAFIVRSQLYQGRLGDMSKTGRASTILDQWFVNPNDLMTWLSKAFPEKVNFWLTNNVLEGLNNVARLPGISQGSQIGIFKGGALDPQGDLAAVESELKRNYSVRFITKGSSRPTDTDLVVFLAHNDGRDGNVEQAITESIRKGLLENRIILLGICGTGIEADLASRILKEGNGRLVIYFDSRISSEALTKVLLSFIKVASSRDGNQADLPALWRNIVTKAASEASLSSEDARQIMVLSNPRFLVIHRTASGKEIWQIKANTFGG